jgi:hypothetical protein
MIRWMFSKHIRENNGNKWHTFFEGVCCKNIILIWNVVSPWIFWHYDSCIYSLGGWLKYVWLHVTRLFSWKIFRNVEAICVEQNQTGGLHGNGVHVWWSSTILYILFSIILAYMEENVGSRWGCMQMTFFKTLFNPSCYYTCYLLHLKPMVSWHCLIMKLLYVWHFWKHQVLPIILENLYLFNITHLFHSSLL